MKTNETSHEMSLQEKTICLMLTGRPPELLYPLKDVECADGTVQRVYEIPDEDKSKVLADLFPLTDGPGFNDVLFNLHERKSFKVRDFLVIRWGEGNLVASPYFPCSVDFPREGQCDGVHRGCKGDEATGKEVEQTSGGCRKVFPLVKVHYIGKLDEKCIKTGRSEEMALFQLQILAIDLRYGCWLKKR